MSADGTARDDRTAQLMEQMLDNTARVDLVAVRPVGVDELTVQCESAVVGGLTTLIEAELT